MKLLEREIFLELQHNTMWVTFLGLIMIRRLYCKMHAMEFRYLPFRSVMENKRKCLENMSTWGQFAEWTSSEAPAMWKWALGACLFAYDAGVGALAKRHGVWAVLELKRIKLSVKRGRSPHRGHIHTAMDRVAKTNQRGKKITLAQTRLSSLLEPGII